MRPRNRTEFIDYCLRQLGAPVLEINVAEEQIQDLVDDALQYFQERHFDGVARVSSPYTSTRVRRRWTTGKRLPCLLGANRRRLSDSKTGRAECCVAKDFRYLDSFFKAG